MTVIEQLFPQAAAAVVTAKEPKQGDLSQKSRQSIFKRFPSISADKAGHTSYQFSREESRVHFECVSNAEEFCN